MKILALSGKMGVGKSYIAEKLEARGWHRQSFGKYLKDDLARAGFSDEMVYGKSLTARTLRQSFGAARRQDEGNYYARQVAKWLEVYALVQDSKDNESVRVVVEDVRYPNELEAIRKFAEEHSGVVLRTVRIERPGMVRLPDRHHLHESETALDHIRDWDVVVKFPEQSVASLSEFAASVDTYEWWSNERNGSSGSAGDADEERVG